MQQREGNSNIEEAQLSGYLTRQGHSAEAISSAIHKLKTEANHPNRSLYDNNKAVYGLLRYGADVPGAPGDKDDTIPLID